MSFFSGFGSNNQNQQQQQQQQQGTGFGGFGSSTTNTNTGGFGASNTGFGGNTNTNTNTGGGLFGNTGGSGFGSGGFGSNNQSSPFGAARTGFGAVAATTSGAGSLFGGGTATSGGTGFGGFGANANANTSSTGFGGTAAAGGAFGQNKPAFGAAGPTGGLFSNPTAGGFGAGNATTGFGSSGNASFGGNAPPTNQGTANTPFTPLVERDGPANQNAHFQSITFLQPYTDFSFEELRLADYAQGRRWGNQNGQAGAFGTSTGFGGFGGTNRTSGFGGSGAAGAGTTAGGLFGTAGSTGSPFGQNQQTQQNPGTGFGNTSTGNSMFGSKPAASGIFGGATTSSQQSGGLFGTSGGTGLGAGTGGGFGAGAAGGGGMFGQQAQNQGQAKSGFGGFGGGTSGGFGSSGTTGFGQQPASSGGGGLFGNTTATASPFGGGQQQQQQPAASSFGTFGQPQQNQNQNQSGNIFGGGFGNTNNQQQKPGGLFGTSTATGGSSLFGQQNAGGQQQQSTGLFGNTNNQQQGGGLFGNKPAPTGNGLFGNTAATPAAGAGPGLFGNLGNNQNQQNQSAGLFGQNPQQQQQQKSLFGTPNTTSGPTGGGGLFGNLNGGNAAQQNQSSGLFGQSAQQQPQLGGSLFGASQPAQQPQQAPALTTSLNANPYGNDQLFASLGASTQNVGPVATPLSSGNQTKKNAILPQYKVNPTAASRLITPQKRPQGYGFSYSTYGTPGSSISSASPAYGGSGLLGGGSFGRSLGKSFSTSNLRHSYVPEDSILAPEAFSPASRSYANTGSLKKLHIDRSLNTRPSLFGPGINSNLTPPALLRKQVSFDTGSRAGNGPSDGVKSNDKDLNGTSGALVRMEGSDSPTPPADDRGAAPPVQPAAGSRSNGASTRPEMEQVNGNELAVVPEEASPPIPTRKTTDMTKEKARLTQKDLDPGEYWMKPTLEELSKMPRQQLKKFSGFVVGRENCGQIEFGDVDLTLDPLERILGVIVVIALRSATVYPLGTIKPARGKGMNVPSLITLENSWPRARGGRDAVYERKGARFDKHLERLKRAERTEFVDYKKETGIWRFRVQHYTTYGMDYEGQEYQDDDLDTTMLSAPPDTPTRGSAASAGASGKAARLSNEDDSMMSPLESSPDDTFEFKKRNLVPGGFTGEEMLYDEDSDLHAAENGGGNVDQFTSADLSIVAEEDDEEGDSDEKSEKSLMEEGEPTSNGQSQIVGSFPGEDQVTELATARGSKIATGSVKPKSILKASQTFRPASNQEVIIGADWAEQLQRTVSPKKKDRQALRESQGNSAMPLTDQIAKHSARPAAHGSTFATSIDLMKSLFGQQMGKQSTNGRVQQDRKTGFEV